ncbi:MAG: ZIP family metal transporter [Planctomycetaceae bacterium]
MAPGFQLAFYALLIMAASMAGGLAPAMMRFTHRTLHLLMSFVAGLMLGVAVFHMLPHAAEKLRAANDPTGIDAAVLWLMVGLLGMFFLIRAFHFHQHASLEPDDALAPGTNAESEHSGCLVHDHGHHHDHDHDHSHDHDHDEPKAQAAHEHDSPSAHKLSWVGIGFGLTVHTLIDGMALAASVRDEALRGGPVWFVGVATFLAIALHKPLDAMSITTLMASSGWSRRWRLGANATFAAMCPIGIMLFFAVDRALAADSQFIGAALAFSAGVFLCISLGDLLPEIQFHHHDRVQLSLALLFGVLLAWCLRFVEPHEHGHSRNDARPSVNLAPTLRVGTRAISTSEFNGRKSAFFRAPALPSVRLLMGLKNHENSVAARMAEPEHGGRQVRKRLLGMFAAIKTRSCSWTGSNC